MEHKRPANTKAKACSAFTLTPLVFFCRATLATSKANDTKVSKLPSVIKKEKSPSEMKCQTKKITTATAK